MISPDVSTEPLNESGVPQVPTVEPTYAPFLLALGITMLFWGIVTSPVMSLGGFIVFVWGMFLWIGGIAQGWRK